MPEYLITFNDERVPDHTDDEAARYWAGRFATVLDWPQEVHRFRGSGRAGLEPTGET